MRDVSTSAVAAAAAATPAADTPAVNKGRRPFKYMSQISVQMQRSRLRDATKILRDAIDQMSGVLAMTRADGSPASADEVLNAVLSYATGKIRRVDQRLPLTALHAEVQIVVKIKFARAFCIVGCICWKCKLLINKHLPKVSSVFGSPAQVINLSGITFFVLDILFCFLQKWFQCQPSNRSQILLLRPTQHLLLKYFEFSGRCKLSPLWRGPNVMEALNHKFLLFEYTV